MYISGALSTSLLDWLLIYSNQNQKFKKFYFFAEIRIFTAYRNQSEWLNKDKSAGLSSFDKEHQKHPNVSKSCCGKKKSVCKMAGCLEYSRSLWFNFISTTEMSSTVLPWGHEILCNRCATRYSKTWVWFTVGEFTMGNAICCGVCNRTYCQFFCCPHEIPVLFLFTSFCTEITFINNLG